MHLDILTYLYQRIPYTAVSGIFLIFPHKGFEYTQKAIVKWDREEHSSVPHYILVCSQSTLVFGSLNLDMSVCELVKVDIILPYVGQNKMRVAQTT